MPIWIVWLEQIIIQLSAQLKLAKDTLVHSLNHSSPSSSELEAENRALKEENKTIKEALKQALIDFEIITEINASTCVSSACQLMNM